MINIELFDSNLARTEQLPRKFTVHFHSIYSIQYPKTQILINNEQIGCIIDDNSRETDGYRFHDVFHFTFSSLLGWSPCVRAMLNRKRKSNSQIDRYEDGARATIIEEAVSLIIFNEAKRNNYFEGHKSVQKHLLKQIKELTSSLEVKARTELLWEQVILTGYSLFRQLVSNSGGKIHFDMIEGTALYEPFNRKDNHND